MKTVAFKINEIEFLVTREIGRTIKDIICNRLSELNPNTILEIDFSLIKIMDASAADEVVVNVLKRLESREYPDKFIILSNVADQPMENIKYALDAAERAVIIKEKDSWKLLGNLVNSYEKALHKVIELGTVTARELQKEMKYNTVNEASTKLSYTYQRRLVAREPLGSRKFRYLSLISVESKK